MKIHEYQSKEILSKYQIPVPNNVVAMTADEAIQKYKESGFETVMIKAQVLAGGRGKAGGIKKASNESEVKDLATKFIGSKLKTYQAGDGDGELIKAILIEKRSDIKEEYYLGIAVNRAESKFGMIFSEAGGMDIEEVASKTPEKVLRLSFDSTSLPSNQELESFFGNIDNAKRSQLVDIATKLIKIYVELDCSLIEINPLALLADGSIKAVDAKIVFDENALFRHPDLLPLKDPDEDDEKERRAKKFGLNYISLGGNVGCLVNGAGLAMATMDTIKWAGGSPANFLDVGGGATKDAVQEAFSIMLSDPDVKAIFVNIFGGIMQCDLIANALVDASREINLNIPVVIRLEGTNVEKGRQILKESGLKLNVASTISEAAKMAVQLAKA